MLNLVQLQERLKDVPMQALMQYANGANPQIPPFLALGELNRRKKMQESAAAEQAQAMEGAPTVKQQIEQAAGLMALQGSRQRQAAQQQQSTQANMPMAAPNTTTSEPAQLAGGGFIDDIVVPRDYQRGGMARGMNPDMLKKLMMMQAMKKRRQGLGQLANNMRRADYAGGGIVAFAGPDGSYVDPTAVSTTEEDEQKKEEQEIAAGLRQGYSPEVRRRMIQKSLEKDRQRMAESGEQERMLERGRDIAREFGVSRTPGARPLMQTSTSAPSRTTRPEGPPVSDRYPDESERGSAKGIISGAEKTRPFYPGDKGSNTGITALIPSAESSSTSRATATPRTNEEIEYLRRIYKQADPDYMAQLKEAGLDQRPTTNKLVEELRRQKQDVEGEDTFTNRLLSLTPGKRFGTGELGRGLMAFEKGQKDKVRALGMEIARAEDLDARADYEFRRGNFDKAQTLKKESQALKTDAAKTAGQLGVNLEQIAATRESTAAQREATAQSRQNTIAVQIEGARTRALSQATKSLDEQINAIAGLAALGQQLTPPQKAQLDALRKERDAIIASINAKFDQMLVQQGGGGAGGFKVIGVKPGAQ